MLKINMKYKSKYKIARVTYESGEVRFVIMKTKRNWLTGEEYWRFYSSNWNWWTRWVSCAETFGKEDEARYQLANILKAEKHNVKSIETVKEYVQE